MSVRPPQRPPGPPPGVSPDVWAQTNALNNSKTGGQGRTAMMRVDRRGRLRNVLSESARSGAAIAVGGGDQILAVCTAPSTSAAPG